MHSQPYRVDECVIERSNGQLNVLDADGNVVTTLPDSWSGQAARVVVSKMNHAYQNGIRTGRLEKAQDIQRALDPENEIIC